ncbi:MAG: zf-HC2 domain-containing protein [Spirochaetes bacterium]|nr:zf-HC2 domain-containing protein [Spirochaetota bacterium]
MTCNQAEKLLSAYCDGELSVDVTASINVHLAGCVSCARAYGELRVLRFRIKAEPPMPASADFYERLMRRIDHARANHHPMVMRIAAVASLAAALAAGVIIAATLKLPSMSPTERYLTSSLTEHELISIAGSTYTAAYK